MPFLTANELKTLYSSGFSMPDIATKENVSVHKVIYWMQKYKISRRSPSEATYTKHNPLGDPFKISALNTDDKKELFALSIGLFLGEGNKKDKYKIRFANSDPKIIQIFLNFLRKICCLKEYKIKAFLNIFDDLNYDECLKYWAGITKISKNDFYKPTIRPGKIGTYKNKSKYGTITISVSNKKLLDQIKLWCNNYLEKHIV